MAVLNTLLSATALQVITTQYYLLLFLCRLYVRLQHNIVCCYLYVVYMRTYSDNYVVKFIVVVVKTAYHGLLTVDLGLGVCLN